jgi:hypothetical protein
MDPEPADSGHAVAPPQAPVAYIVFNRPQHTRRTFEAIRAHRPARLFIIADGPRPDRPDDVERCQEVRRIVADVDWPCQVQSDLAATNLGCARRVSSGLGWVFSHVERAIVLEDDCVASPTFFAFCEQLLERYRDDDAVWVVNGNSYQPQFRRGDGSYYFSKYPDTWGWATWRRAWSRYQHDLPFLEEWLGSRQWVEGTPVKSERRYLEHAFRQALAGELDSWAYRWTACILHGGGLCATPNANLVRNIGFDEEATHTRGGGLEYEVTGLGPIEHPSAVRADVEADAYFRNHFGFERNVAQALKGWLRNGLRRARRAGSGARARVRGPER